MLALETKFLSTALDAQLEFCRDELGHVSYARLRQKGSGRGVEEIDFFVLLGFFAEKVPECEQNRRKPEKTCGNRRILIDKALGKDEGELR
jgi:hypothetical protein